MAANDLLDSDDNANGGWAGSGRQLRGPQSERQRKRLAAAGDRERNCLSGADTITFGVSGTILLLETLGAGDPAGLTIDGTGQSITISGNEAVRVMSVGGLLTLRNLTITGGYEKLNSGAGIVNSGTLNVINSTVSGNRADAEGGGGINNGGTLNVTGSTFFGNTAFMGAAIINSGTLSVTNSTFSGNFAYGNGGAISNAGTLTVTGSTFSGNLAGSFGGGIDNLGTTLVTGSTFSGNHATGGGGIVNENYGGTLEVTNSTFSDNSADRGGGIYNFGTLTVTVNNSTFSGNYGGGISNYDGTLNVTNSTFSGNYGGGISNAGTLTVTDSSFSENSDGGMINDTAGTATVTKSTFSANSAIWGGGIYNYGTLNVTNSTFSGNTANSFGGYDGQGGGIFNTGTLEVTNSTFSGNFATINGGGIFNSGTATLKNTIMAHSPSGGNCSGLITDGGGNLSWPDTSCPGLNADPLLGPLQDHGGPTQTHALLPGSPAIDVALLANCPATDQRGISRPQGAGCDIGAYESVAYNFSGFFQPVDNLPTWNVVQAGVGVPVRFSLGGDYGLNIFAAGYPMAQKIACRSGVPQDIIEETVIVGSSRLSYDAASDTYAYAWKTSKAWAGTCRQLILRLNDGTEHTAKFKFVR